MYPEIYNDSLHGSMRLDEWERKLLELHELQRLRYIKQTGLAFLAYPSARHSILDHMLGALCLAKKYVHHLGIDERERKVLLVSVLLRDIGSEPLRHVLWDVNSRIPEEKRLTILGSDAIVRESEQIRTILDNIELKVDDICKMIQLPYMEEGEGWLRKLRPLIHGPLSFNRLDYYLRDAYYAGIKGIGFDLGEIFKNISFHEKRGFVYNEEAVPSIENVLLSRINLYFKLYSNPEAIKGQKMLVRVIERFMDNDHEKFYNFRKEAINEFLSDDEFMHTLKEKVKDDKAALDIVQLIETGQLYKTLDRIYRWPKLPSKTQKRLEWYIKNPMDWKKDEREVNSRLHADFGQIIIDFDKPTVKDLIKDIFISKDKVVKRIDAVSPLIGPLKKEEDKKKKRRKYGILEMEKRNWFFGVYYDYKKVKNLGVNENKIKKTVKRVFKIRLY